jgi:uncharacterized protein (DUF305 family)
MSEMAQDVARTPEVRHLAQTMVRGQQAEITLMSGMLRERGARTDG